MKLVPPPPPPLHPPLLYLCKSRSVFLFCQSCCSRSTLVDKASSTLELPSVSVRISAAAYFLFLLDFSKELALSHWLQTLLSEFRFAVSPLSVPYRHRGTTPDQFDSSIRHVPPFFEINPEWLGCACSVPFCKRVSFLSTLFPPLFARKHLVTHVVPPGSLSCTPRPVHLSCLVLLHRTCRGYTARGSGSK